MNEELRKKLSQVVEKTVSNLQNAGNLETLNEIRVGVLGKKGELKQLTSISALGSVNGK